ncbi:hypothetical protein KIN20_018477 [Parelaphostrongylus tenuis]|uniref:Uncharacterized protein n=1 Tax=Parelaphostrongylus tenuis TaxID=148309 RepID=A0AAD5MN34_PARTN|nr:hypothetical protein KIN20_018477 [Parelaphostrongylus tenuis]
MAKSDVEQCHCTFELPRFISKYVPRPGNNLYYRIVDFLPSKSGTALRGIFRNAANVKRTAVVSPTQWSDFLTRGLYEDSTRRTRCVTLSHDRQKEKFTGRQANDSTTTQVQLPIKSSPEGSVHLMRHNNFMMENETNVIHQQRQDGR